MHFPFDTNSLMILAVGGLGAWNAYQQSKIRENIAELKVWIFENFERIRIKNIGPAE